MNEEKRNRKNLLLFPIASIGRDMAYALFTNFLLTYVLFTRHLDASQLTAITLIMVAARIFDGLNDPIMGNIVECTDSKYGKFKPWLVLGILSTSAVIIVTFNSSLQGWSFIALFGLMYFLYSIAYTMHDISYWGMIASLGSDANTRNQFTSRATLFAGIGSCGYADSDVYNRIHGTWRQCGKSIWNHCHRNRNHCTITDGCDSAWCQRKQDTG